MNFIKNIFKITLSLSLIIGCTPDKYEPEKDNSIVDISTITKIVLAPNHNMLIADGKASIDLRAMLHTDDNNIIPDNRITPDMLEYTSSIDNISRYFSTDDASLIGTSIEVSVKLKGTELVSETISFDVIAPLESKYSEIKIPIVFHIIQTSLDITEYGGPYKTELIDQMLLKMNNMLSGSRSLYPTIVDTGVRLERALYSSSGAKFIEPGINRVTVDTINIKNSFKDLIKENELLWPPTQYLNVWLISDRPGIVTVSNFSKITNKCIPKYYNEGINANIIPTGFSLVEYPEGTEFDYLNSGIIYKLQEITNTNRNYSLTSFNDLGHYIGQYLGLSRTNSYSNTSIKSDNCDDTIDYNMKQQSSYKWFDEKIYFKSENIMDDGRGLHIAVSKEQSKRMRWILENVPERSAWKSSFAFTGE